MGKGAEVSPVVAGIIIVIVLVIAGFLVFRYTGGRGAAGVSPEQMRAAIEEANRRPRGGAQGSGGVSNPAPGAVTPGGGAPVAPPAQGGAPR